MVHYYNPDNDLCLASGLTNYTPPRAAQQLRDAGSMLPLWYGDPGDAVISFGVNARWYQNITEAFNIAVNLWDHNPEGCVPDPWGWSLTVRKYFLDLGFAPCLMPSEGQINRMRQLSHRRTALDIAESLYQEFPMTEPGKECFSTDQVQALYHKWGDIMVKFPWSSSGRGLANSRLTGCDKALRMARESIAKQGSVIVERAHVPLLNIALLYECASSSCQFIGTSVFNTDIRGIYTGNILGSEEYLLSVISQYYDLELLSQIRESMRLLIQNTIAPSYTGILGADLLITDDGILALVEINLRKTMGYVAHRFSDSYLHPASKGTLSILPALSTAMPNDNVIESHHLLSGAISLTPPNAHFSFLVQAQVR